MSITELLEDRNKRKSKSKIYGVVVGIVTNIKDDPDKLGRVKVKIPRLSGDDESFWARVATFIAGPDRGAFFLPEKDDEVLVAFEQGEIKSPYIIGSLWNGVDKQPETNSDGKNNIQVFKSRSGHIIRFTNKKGEEKIEIIDKTGNNFISIDTKDNKITISSDKDIDLSAPNGKITVKAEEIEINSSASTMVKASTNIDINASKITNIKGTKAVNIN